MVEQKYKPSQMVEQRYKTIPDGWTTVEEFAVVIVDTEE